MVDARNCPTLPVWSVTLQDFRVISLSGSESIIQTCDVRPGQRVRNCLGAQITSASSWLAIPSVAIVRYHTMQLPAAAIYNAKRDRKIAISLPRAGRTALVAFSLIVVIHYNKVVAGASCE
eukprot:scaffold221975_cov24-Prasinocladus_malaysianus.AAC.1